MGNRSSETVLRHLHTLFNVGIVSGLTDGQLLEQFACRRGEAAEIAFAALVERHGPMVLTACLGIVGNDHDAQDAFQATFLILARKSKTLWVRDSLGPWLHRVACRAAVRVKVASNRRRATERRLAEMSPGPATSSRSGSLDDLIQKLHEEVDRLPDHYRRPVVLCDLEGHSYEEAAKHLNCPVGTIRSRLARGRERLRSRLVRRGMSPAEQSGADIGPKTVPAILLKSTIDIVLQAQLAGAGSASVLALARGVLRAMLLTKIKTTLALTLAVGVSMVGLGLLGRGLAREAADNAAPAVQEAGQAKGENIVAPRVVVSEPAPGPRDETSPRPKSFFQAPGPLRALLNSSQDKVWAFSPDAGIWHSYTTPKGVRINDYSVLPQLITLSFGGEQITEIAAFCVKPGKWSRQALIEPVKGPVQPIRRSNHIAVYLLGRHAYAFNAWNGKWSHQPLGEAVRQGIVIGSVIVGDDFAVYPQGRYVYAFSALTGNWTTLELEEGARAIIEKGPDGIAYFSGGSRLNSFDAKTGRFQEVPSTED